MSERKLFIIQKYVMARTIQEAIRIEKKQPVQEAFLDGDWKKNMLSIEQFPPPPQVGFKGKRKKK